MDEISKYRDILIRGRECAVRSFDDWLMKLSAGALAIALGLVRAGPGQPPREQWTLVVSWMLFTLALALMLASFRTSHAAFTSALTQTADALDPSRPWRETPGGIYTKATTALTYISGVCFLLGVVALGYFTTANLGSLR
jgi:magnesium-transporting ATPase (P-type)